MEVPRALEGVLGVKRSANLRDPVKTVHKGRCLGRCSHSHQAGRRLNQSRAETQRWDAADPKAVASSSVTQQQMHTLYSGQTLGNAVPQIS